MPLVEPITMSTTLAKGAAARAQAQAAFSKTAPVFPVTMLRPVQIRSTPLAQAARHALPALLAVLFGARFRALVADPSSAMATALPLVAALQVAYAILCLPAPGSTQGGGGGARKAQKPRPGESIKKRGADAGTPNAVAVCCAVSPLIAYCFRSFRSECVLMLVVMGDGTDFAPLASSLAPRVALSIRGHDLVRRALSHSQRAYLPMCGAPRRVGALPAVLRARRGWECLGGCGQLWRPPRRDLWWTAWGRGGSLAWGRTDPTRLGPRVAAVAGYDSVWPLRGIYFWTGCGWHVGLGEKFLRALLEYLRRRLEL